MTGRRRTRLALGMMLLPVLPGVGLCVIRPQWAWWSAFAVLLMPVLWIGLQVRAKIYGNVTLGAMLSGETAARASLAWAMAFSSCIIAFILGVKLGSALKLIDLGLANAAAIRGPNFLVGGYLALKGNQLPKLLKPLPDLRSDPATLQAFQRRMGQILVLTGVTCAVAALALPISLAEPIGIGIVLVGALAPWLVFRILLTRRLGPPVI